MNRHAVSKLISLGLCGATVAGWMWASPQGEVVFGRFSLHSLLALLFLTTVSIVAIILNFVATSRAGRFRIAAVLLGAAAAWIVVDGVLFAVDPWRPNPFYTVLDPAASTPDARLRFKRPPHLYWEGVSTDDSENIGPLAERVVFRTDADGFRNSHELSNVEIAFVGDSFTEAGNVGDEETFANRTGALLGRTTGKWAIAGYGPLEELAVLEHYSLRRKPAWVVWQLYEGNDLSDIDNYLWWQEARRNATTSDAPGMFAAADERWFRSSPFVRTLRRLGDSHRHRKFRLEGEFATSSGELLPIRFGVVPSEHTDPAYAPFRWSHVAEALDSGRRLCDAKGARLVVLFIPLKIRVMGERTRFANADSAEARSVKELTSDSRFGQAVRDYCRKGEFEFLDVSAALRERADTGELMYFCFDEHLAPAGHALVAGMLAERIRELE